MLVNFNGHFNSGEQGIVESDTFNNGWYNHRLENAVNYMEICSVPDADMERCPVCGAYLRLIKDGDHYEVATRVKTGEREYKAIGKLPVFESQFIPCKYPDGMKPFEVTIEVPSGKLAFFNFLTPDNDPVPQNIMYSGDCDISITAGMVNYTKEYGRNNILYPYCGNTSVVAYKTSEGIDFRHNYECDDEGNDIYHEGQIGESVCCDVWWFTALDLELLKKLYNTDKPEEKFDDFVVLDVEPGTYTFTMNYSEKLRYRILASGKLTR